MSVFNRFLKTNSSKDYSKSVKGFYFGAPEAEAETKKGKQNLSNYFEDYFEIFGEIKNGKFIISGRKGVGKSAIAKIISDSADNDAVFCSIIRLNDIKSEEIIQNIPENSVNISRLLLEWIIYVKLIRLIVKNKSAQHTPQFNRLKKFLQINSGIIDFDRFEISELSQSGNLSINFTPLKEVFGASFNTFFDKKQQKAPFYRLIEPIREIIREVLNQEVHINKQFWLIFDDLDIGFDKSNPNSRTNIAELIRTVKHTNTELLSGTEARVIILLRDDIKNIVNLENADMNKIFNSYEITINWYHHSDFRLNENNTKLKQFINRRIEINFQVNDKDYDSKDPWSTLIMNDSNYNLKSPFKYIIDHTFYRPRDIILFLSPIGSSNFEYPLSFPEVKQLLNQFANNHIGEVKNELSLHFKANEVEIIINKILFEAAQKKMSKSSVLQIIKEYLPQYECENIFDVFIEYNYMIYMDHNDYPIFNYRELNSKTISLDDLDVVVHRCLLTYYKPLY